MLDNWQDLPDAATQSSNERRLAILKREIDRLGGSRVERKDVSVDSELAGLEEKMQYGFTTDDYEVSVYPDRELISGRRGSYYSVDLKDAETGVKFKFEAGRYTLDHTSRKFRAALGVFMRDVVSKLDGKKVYKLMVRGSADSASYRGRFEKGFEYKKVTYLKQISNGRYGNGTESRRLSNRVKNSDLPFLRARFLKELVGDVYPSDAPSILEGIVTDQVDSEDRNVELFLFVGW